MSEQLVALSSEDAVRAEWARTVRCAAAIPALELVRDARASCPTFHGINRCDRAVLVLPPGYDITPGVLFHEAGHALQAVAPVQTIVEYWRLRGLDEICTVAQAYERALQVGRESLHSWCYEPPERFAESFAAVFCPSVREERHLPGDWHTPTLSEQKRQELRLFFAGLPRRPGSWYIPNPTSTFRLRPPSPSHSKSRYGRERNGRARWGR